MSWSHEGETFPVEITVAVRFRMQVSATIKPLTSDTTEEETQQAAERLREVIQAANEQVEAGVIAELSKRVPGVQFHLEDRPPDGWQD